MVKIITLTIDNIVSEMLFDFCHHQVITKICIHDNNEWKTTDTHILREWSLEKKKWISQYLQQQIERGGFVVAAFDEDILIGFCSIDGRLLGKTAKYANMTMLFVDDRYKRKGIGKKLFFEIVKSAFGQRRKTLLNALSKSPYLNVEKEIIQEAIESANLKPDIRGERLTLSEFAKIADFINERKKTNDNK